MPTRSAARRLLAAAMLLVLPAAPAAAQQYIHSDERREQLQQLIEQHQPPDADHGAAANAYLQLELLLRSFDTLITEHTAAMRASRGAEWYIPFESVNQNDNPTPLRHDEVRRVVVLMENAGIFRGAEALAGAHRAVRPPVTENTNEFVDTQMLGRMRILLRAIESRLVFALQAHDAAATIASYKAWWAISRVQRQQLSMLDWSLGEYAANEANEHLRRELINGRISPAAFVPLSAAIESQLGYVPPITAVLEADRIAVEDALEHDPESLWLSKKAAGENPRAAATLYRKIADAAATLEAIPPQQRTTNPAAIEARKFLTAQSPAMETLDFPKVQASVYLILIDKAAAAATNAAATRIMLALERHRFRTGSYPEALADLVPNELPDLEGNFPAPCGLIYRREGRAYRLYSPGYDTIDNGGAPVPEHLDRAFTPEGAGFDCVYR